jgi:hypothetical protein
MTEADWLAAADPTPMLAFLRRKASDRKLRLFACGCARFRWAPLPDARSRDLLDLAERYADGEATDAEIGAARRIGYCMGLVWTVNASARVAAEGVIGAVGLPKPAPAAALLRDLFANPFRPPPPVEPAWLAWNGGTAAKLARSIYDDRAFDRLPLLADALEDAGCTDAAILGHLRGRGPHVRGCWAVDLVLDKA